MLGDGLRLRLLTSALLVPLIVGGILLLPTSLFALLMAIVVLLATWEWTKLAGLTGLGSRGAMVVVAGAGLLLLWLYPPPPALVLVPTCLWWLGFGLTMPRLRPIPMADRGAAVAELVLGSIVLLAPWFALVTVHGSGPEGPPLVLSLMFLIWGADSAAYFAGRRFGRRKLAPRLSPGKTWEGFYAALGMAAVIALVSGLLVGLDLAAAAGLIVLGVVTGAVSVVGDLFESWLKRRRGLKDSGALLPGHGGMLDRIDSMTAAAPVFALGLIWLGLAV